MPRETWYDLHEYGYTGFKFSTLGKVVKKACVDGKGWQEERLLEIKDPLTNQAYVNINHDKVSLNQLYKRIGSKVRYRPRHQRFTGYPEQFKTRRTK